MGNFYIDFDKEAPEKVSITGIICGTVYLIARLVGIIYIWGRLIKFVERMISTVESIKEDKEED